MPLQAQFVVGRLGLVWSTCTPTLKSLFTHCKDMKGNTKCRFWGLRWPTVTSNVTIRESAYDFLFDSNRNYDIMFSYHGNYGGWMGMALCSLLAPVDVAAGCCCCTLAHCLGRHACCSESAGPGACCLAAGLVCCRGWWCTFRCVLHACSELYTRDKVWYLVCSKHNFPLPSILCKVFPFVWKYVALVCSCTL